MGLFPTMSTSCVGIWNPRPSRGGLWRAGAGCHLSAGSGSAPGWSGHRVRATGSTTARLSSWQPPPGRAPRVATVRRASAAINLTLGVARADTKRMPISTLPRISRRAAVKRPNVTWFRIVGRIRFASGGFQPQSPALAFRRGWFTSLQCSACLQPRRATQTTPGTESFEDQHRRMGRLRPIRQVPLNRWVCCRSRTFGSGEVGDGIRPRAAGLGNWCGSSTQPSTGLLGGSAAFRCRDLAGPGDGAQLRAEPCRSKSLLETAFGLDLWRRIYAVTISLAACSRSKEISCAGVGRQGAVDHPKTAGLVDNAGGAVGSSHRSQDLTPQVSETDILARGGRPLASTRATPSRLARLRGACWMSWGRQRRKSRAAQRD